jgi:hypothetical protein
MVSESGSGVDGEAAEGWPGGGTGTSCARTVERHKTQIARAGTTILELPGIKKRVTVLIPVPSSFIVIQIAGFAKEFLKVRDHPAQNKHNQGRLRAMKD